MCFFFFFQAEDGIRDIGVTGVQTCALPISCNYRRTGLGDDSYAGGVGGSYACGLLGGVGLSVAWADRFACGVEVVKRSEEHTSELQSRQYLVCRLLLEKKNEAGDEPNHLRGRTDRD